MASAGGGGRIVGGLLSALAAAVLTVAVAGHASPATAPQTAAAAAVPTPAAPDAAAPAFGAHPTAAHRALPARHPVHRRPAAHPSTAAPRPAPPAPSTPPPAPSPPPPAPSTPIATADPLANRAATPDFTTPCEDSGAYSAACESAAVGAVNHARAAEGLAPMALPAGYWALPTAEQVFIVTNLERAGRRLRPVLGLTADLDPVAQHATAANTDPELSGSSIGADTMSSWGSIWGAGFNPVAIDYIWMYEDGWGGAGSTANLACTSPSASGCWGHRHNILGGYGGAPLLLAGAGSVARGYDNYYESDAEIMVGASGRQPALTYSWAQAVASGAR